MDIEQTAHELQGGARRQLASWIVALTGRWLEHRRQGYDSKWAEFQRMYLGEWDPRDRMYQSERSRIVTPGVLDAVETAVSMFEETVFSNTRWFDLVEEMEDSVLLDAAIQRERLLEDLDVVDAQAVLSEAFLNGALFGTGIVKIIPEVAELHEPALQVNTETGALRVRLRKQSRTYCYLEAVPPQQFVIDPSVAECGTKGIERAFGCAHMLYVPRHRVMRKQAQGLYYQAPLGTAPEERSLFPDDSSRPSDMEAMAKITEYHGLVPKELLEAAARDGEAVADPCDPYNHELVEALVTVANDSVLLRAEENDLLKRDRAFVAFAYDVLPGRFWGVGVAEKGQNPQRVNDAVVRAVLDSLALSARPMVAGNVTMLPRGMDFSVQAGRTIPVIGRPSEVLEVFRFPGLDPNVWNATALMERYLQKGTGTFDAIAPLRENRRNATLGGMSIMAGAMARRTKRALWRAEREMILPLIHKMLWRYYELEPKRYPPVDVKYRVIGTLGIMAKEAELQQLASMLNVIPPEHPAFGLILAGIVKATNLHNKEQIVEALAEAQVAAAQAAQQVDPRVEQELRREEARIAETQARTQRHLIRARNEAQKGELDMIEALDKLEKQDRD